MYLLSLVLVISVHRMSDGISWKISISVSGREKVFLGEGWGGVGREMTRSEP